MRKRLKQGNLLKKNFSKTKMYEIIKEMRETGATNQAIADQLNSDGWTTKTGKVIGNAYISLIYHSYREKYYGRKNKVPKIEYETVKKNNLLERAKAILNSNLSDDNKTFLLKQNMVDL